MKKYLQGQSLFWSITASVVFVFLLVGSVWADSTIGTNMSTTGTFTITPATDSATSVRFQNAAGTNILIANSTSRWVGVGASPQTTFEVQGTSSASYFLTGNTIQVGGYASVAYNRFGTAATTHSLSATNDVLIGGILETDGKTFLDGTASVASDFEIGGMASISGVLNLADGEIRSENNSTTALRFQNAAGSTTVMTIDTTNSRVGIGKTPATTLDISGSASASVNFEAVGYASASTGFFTTDLIVGNNVASSSSIYAGEFGAGKTGTISLLFGSNTAAATTGTCIQMKNSVGAWVYLRVFGTTLTVNTQKCHQ